MDEASLRQKMAAKIDEQMRGLIMGAANVTTNVAEPQEPLTLDRLGRMVAYLRAKIGLTPLFLSSRLFPNDKAIAVESGTEKFVCAGPGFWARLQYEASRDTLRQSDPSKTGFAPMFGIRITEIDAWPDDPPDVAKWRADHWRRLREAFEVAAVELPGWLNR